MELPNKDDGTIIGDATEVAKALEIIRSKGPSLGLELNIKKTEVIWPSCNGVKTKSGLFPVGIGRPELGVKLLGGAVSRDVGFISSLAIHRASKAVDLMRSLTRLAAIDDIVVCGGPFFGDFQWTLASLPICFGALGLYSTEDVSTYAFVALRAQSWKLQDHILRNCSVDGLDPNFGCALDCLHNSIPDLDLGGFTDKDTAPPKAQNVLASALYSKTVQSLGEKFSLSTRQKAVLECLQTPHAQDFLTVIPIEGLGQHMSAVEYRAILKYRLMIPLFPVDEPCPICRKVCLDKFGEHAVHCKELPGPYWGVPLVGLRDTGFVARQAVLKAELGKIAKHEKACAENQHAFIPFAFDTFGSLVPDDATFLKRVQQIVHSNSSTPKNTNFVFSRIRFAIQKGVAAQLVSRLPAFLL
ncbi:hypothetical protein R6Q59_026848 [Mikania micrantha]